MKINDGSGTIGKRPTGQRRLVAGLATILVTGLVGSLGAGEASAAAHAWSLATSADDGAKYFIDSVSIRAVIDEPTQVIFWEKITNRSIPLRGKIVRTSISRTKVDCLDNTISVGPITYYDKRNRVIGTDSTWEDWADVQPDSVGQGVRDFACADWDTENL